MIEKVLKSVPQNINKQSDKSLDGRAFHKCGADEIKVTNGVVRIYSFAVN